MSLGTFAGNLPRDSLQEEWEEQGSELVLYGCLSRELTGDRGGCAQDGI